VRGLGAEDNRLGLGLPPRLLGRVRRKVLTVGLPVVLDGLDGTLKSKSPG
jgi:hypothetical protein